MPHARTPDRVVLSEDFTNGKGSLPTTHDRYWSADYGDAGYDVIVKVPAESRTMFTFAQLDVTTTLGT